MNEMDNIDNFTDKDWICLASILSDEKVENTDLLNRFIAMDLYSTVDQWKELKNMNIESNKHGDRQQIPGQEPCGRGYRQDRGVQKKGLLRT